MKVMRNSIKGLLMAALSVSAVSGCISDDVYGSHGEDDPGYIIFTESYVWQINNFFRCAEMCDFFTEYQKVRQDREASERLADEYFGDAWSALYYEKLYTTGGTPPSGWRLQLQVTALSG